VFSGKKIRHHEEGDEVNFDQLENKNA
jgi:hypothetical protein